MQSHISTLIERGKSTLGRIWVGTPGWVVYLAAVIAVAAWLGTNAVRPMADVDFDLSSVRSEIGYAYLVRLSRPQGTPPIFSTLPDSVKKPKASQLQLYEANRPLGPPHSPHKLIREEGQGRYSHWGGYLYFSTSDNTDPRTNGRTYRAVYPLSIAPWFEAAIFLLVLTALIRAVSSQWSRVRSVSLMGSDFFLDPAVDRRSPWVWFILGLGAVGIAWLYIFGLWWTGESASLTVAGVLPVSDSLGYQKCAREIIDLGQAYVWCHARPLYTSFFASLWILGDRHLDITLLLQAAVLTGCIVIFAKEAARWLGLGPALMVAIAVFLFSRQHAFALVMTENIGLALGLMALALLLNAAGRGRLAIAHLGLAVLTLALHARAGAFFVLPFVVLWIGYLARRQERSFFLHSGLAVLSVVCAVLANFALISSIGGEIFGAHSNFPLTFYGLSAGGDWMTIMKDHPELPVDDQAKAATEIYRLAFENIRNDPTVFLLSLLKNEGRYFQWVLFDYADGPIHGALWLAWIAGLFVSAVFARSDPRAALLLAITLGEMASAPLIVGDGGARLFAATSSVQPLLAVYAVVIIFQTTALRRLYASFTKPAMPAGEPPRAAYAMLVILGLAIALPQTPVRKAFAEKPAAGIEACEKGYETVVSTLHRNASVLTVRGDNSPARFWPVRVHYRQLAAGIPDNSWFKSEFVVEPPLQIVQAPQLLANDFTTLKRLFWTGRDELPMGPLVRLCVDRSETRDFAQAPYYRIVSYKELD